MSEAISPSAPALPSPLVLWANFWRQRGTRGMSLLTARRGAERGDDDEGWREKRDNTSQFGKASAEKLHRPSVFLCRAREHSFTFVNRHTRLRPLLLPDAEVSVFILRADLGARLLNFSP